MKSIIRLIRIPNLVIIILTQLMIRYFIISPLLAYQSVEPSMSLLSFTLLVAASVLIAAAGYIINDYFDVDADRVNKPEKVIVGKKMRFEHAKIIYYILNGIAIAIGFYLGLSVDSFQLGLIFPIIIIMLYYYSARYKNMVFWGNLVVGLLSGFSVFIVWLFEFFALRLQPEQFLEAREAFAGINMFVWAYAGFALLTSLIREMIKDIQDLEGDRRVGSFTMPIVLGVKTSKTIIFIISLVTIISLAFAQYILYGQGFLYAAWYLLFAVQSLLVYLLVKLPGARAADEFKFLSGLSKIIMLAGILSMQLIYLTI